MLLCPLIHASFVDVVLLFSFHYETTRNAKFIFYAKENGSWTWKAWRYKDGGEAGEVSLLVYFFPSLILLKYQYLGPISQMS